MSFESAAPATDEFSILDLFGPEASPQAQLLVQEAADRSMDEMAEVINAAKARDGSQDSGVKALLAEQIDFVPYHTIGHANPLVSSMLQNAQDLQEEIDNLLNPTRDGYKAGFGFIKPPYPVFPFSPEITRRGVHVNEEANVTARVIGRLSPEVFAQFVRMRDSTGSLSTRLDIAAKESLLSQLAHQLTLAMAEGVNLSNASIVLNKQNPTTKRIESVTIHAEGDDNDRPDESERHDLEWMLRRAYAPRHE
ncbi:hypothetical protein [[Curtobacterium] plantarum]|uniref:hypothetical protein n=1 Tax=[Curtobacterium] plantarum TaxID=221276 RepID=UPI000F076183|nr:hypothetical protein [[Curtobacterium] plantarum]RNA73517.1 hypothetical protein EBO33_21760 [[Curtobacterium] plantarum]